MTTTGDDGSPDRSLGSYDDVAEDVSQDLSEQPDASTRTPRARATFARPGARAPTVATGTTLPQTLTGYTLTEDQFNRLMDLEERKPEMA